MYVKVLLVAALMLVFGIVMMPAGIDASSPVQIMSAGCKTEYFLLKDLADAYQKKTGIKLRPASTGNKRAMELMLARDVDFAFTCKPIGQLSRKLKLNPAKTANWKSIPIAKDPIVVVSNKRNAVDNLTVEQLTDIFGGEITNWADVGGAEQAIRVAYFESGMESGSQLLFKEFTVGGEGTLTPDARTLSGPSMLGNYVSRTPGGVTFMPLNAYKNTYGDIVAIGGVAPSRQTIDDGRYRLMATYYLTVDPAGNKEIDAFISYCLSAEGKRVIARNFVPFSE